jgi:hypothetical protein
MNQLLVGMKVIPMSRKTRTLNLWIDNRIEQNSKPYKNKELQENKTVIYKPAFAKKPKKALN